MAVPSRGVGAPEATSQPMEIDPVNEHEKAAKAAQRWKP